MSKRRDRHARGLRGPLAGRSPLTGRVAPLRRHSTSAAYFLECVGDSIARIQRQCPGALDGITVGVEDVPPLSDTWQPDRVPLAAAVERTDDAPGQIVVYRRPLERRAATRRGLGILVYHTVVEQLAALTGLEVTTIDPNAGDDPDDPFDER